MEAGTPLIIAEGMNGVRALRAEFPNQLREVVAAVRIPVQAVGGLSIEQAIRTPEYGAPLVVLGAPLTIDANSFKAASGDLEDKLRLICTEVHAYGDIPVSSANKNQASVSR